MHNSMRWAHTLACMRSRRWGREESNGRIQLVGAVTQGLYLCAHKPHFITCMWVLYYHCSCSVQLTQLPWLSAKSLLSLCCFNCCSPYPPCTQDFLSLPCEYREMLTIPHIFSSQTTAEGLHHKETQPLLGYWEKGNSNSDSSFKLLYFCLWCHSFDPNFIWIII